MSRHPPTHVGRKFVVRIHPVAAVPVDVDSFSRTLRLKVLLIAGRPREPTAAY
jgi:hypothetical protein